MRHVVSCLSIVWLLATVVACGTDSKNEQDVKDLEVFDVSEVTGEDSVQPTNCVGMDGEPCSDGDPCKIGEGVCEADECHYDDNQILSCDTPPDECSQSAGCSPDGCLWQLAAGFCRIDESCIVEGAGNPGNECSHCDPVENRGDWTPLTGTTCSPKDNPCATSGACQSGFCVPLAAGDLCATDTDCLAKDDGDACNGGYACKDCSCIFEPSSVVECDTEGDTACAATACNPGSGECEQAPLEDGTSCEDGDPCTSLDYCVGGECTSGQVAPPVWKASPDANTAYITALAQNGSNLYAVGSGGVIYRSADGGVTYGSSDVLASGGDLGDWLFVVGVGTESILTLFGESLIVSNNSGITYSEKLTGCEALAQAAQVPNTFVAVCNQQLHLSNDAGASWQAGGSIPFGGNSRVNALAVSDGLTFYLGSTGEDAEGRGYVYRSTDGGSSWSAIDPPDRPDLAAVAHRGLFISPKAPLRLFLGYESTAGKVFGFGQTPLFRSADGGDTFVPLNSGLQGQSFVPLAMDGAFRLLVGVDRVLVRGGGYGDGPWGAIPPPDDPTDILFHTITSMLIMPGNDFSYFVPVSNGVAFAKDLGLTWLLYNDGLNGPVFSRIATCAGGASMFAVERFSNGLFRSTDAGESWAQLVLPPAAEGMTVTNLMCAPATGNSVYAFTADGGLLFSNNGGTTFSYLDESNGPVLASHNAIASFPDSPTRILVSRLGMGLFLTEDAASPQGAGYAPVDLPEAYVASVATDPFDNGRFYVGTIATPDSPHARIYVCTDFGSTCSMQKQSAVIEADAPRTEYHLTADPSVSGRVFAALSGEEAGVVYSTDSGSSWQDFVSLPRLSTRGGNEILADPDSAGSFFASFWLHGLYYYDQLVGEWLRLDAAPEGVSSLAWDPTNGALLAGSGMVAKLYSSADNGGTWVVAKDFGQTDYHVQSVVVGGDYLFVLLQAKVHNSTKLFVRVNGQWVESVIGTAITSVTVQQPENETVLATGKFGGLYLSEDGGATFAPFGSLDAGGLDIAVSPAEPQVVMAAVTCGQLASWYDPNQTQLGSQCGIRRSLDGGLSWSTVLSSGSACTRVTPSANVGGMWFATCPGSGVYYSTDDGSNWSTLSGWGYLDEVNTLAVSASSLFFGTNARGLARATLDPASGLPTAWDGSLSDEVRTLLPVSTIRMELQPNSSSRVYVYSQPGGLIRTDNFGSEWFYAGGRLAPEEGTALPTQQLPAMVPRIVSSNQDDQLWVAVAGRGIFVSQDGGDHWLFSSGSSLPVSTSHPVDLIADKAFANFVWLASKEGFFRTSDLGGLWQKIETGLGKGTLEAILPPNNNALFVSVAGAGLYSVPFDGAAWTKAHAVNFFGSESAAWNGRRLGLWHFPLGDPASEKTYLVGMDPSGLYKTLDGGVSFQQVGNGLPAGRVLGLARSPHNAQLIVAGTPQGIYSSTDGGATFSAFGELVGDVGPCFSFDFDAESDATIYALCATGLPHGLGDAADETSYGNRVLYVTNDGGIFWEAAGEGLVSGKHPVAVLADRVFGGVVYVATLEGGVLRSEDGGDIFEPWSLGLPGPYTGGRGLLHSSPLAFTPNGALLVLGTEGLGMYTRLLSADCE